MQFDYTYFYINGFIVFEPLIAISNGLMLLTAIYYFRILRKYEQRFSRQFAWFMLFTGLGSAFGAMAHCVHFQWGDHFFYSMLFLMNAMSLVSALFFFLSVHSYYTRDREQKAWMAPMAWIWLGVLLLITFVQNEFVLVKIHAGFVLLFTLLVFTFHPVKRDPGSRLIVNGILVALASVLVHTLRISFHEWFNHKDFAHVLMLFSMFLFYRGALLNSRHIAEADSTALVA